MKRRAYQFLRPPEAARLLCVSERTLQRWRHRGSGPRAAKIGGRIIYALADLIAFASKSECSIPQREMRR